jgi:CHASE3 domain sensor protein
MEDLINIWNADDELNEDELMNYIKKKSSAGEEHNIEKKMADSPFVNDAVEGLQNFSSTEKANAYVQQLNDDLRKHLHTKKYRKKNTISNLSWEIVTVIIVILLCILGYVIIVMMK